MREITGKHVFLFTVSAFAVIISVNLTMAYKAVSTFPGLEVKSSYVASQSFDGNRAAQKALGWTMKPNYDPVAKELQLVFTGQDGLPVALTDLKVLVGRTTSAGFDSNPAFTRQAGAYTAKADLAHGKWMMQVTARAADGTLFQQRIDLFVKG